MWVEISLAVLLLGLPCLVGCQEVASSAGDVPPTTTFTWITQDAGGPPTDAPPPQSPSVCLQGRDGDCSVGNAALLDADESVDGPAPVGPQEAAEDQRPAGPTQPPTLTSATSTEKSDPEDWRTDHCTCDLTVSGCDTDCCCDPDCTSVDRATFSRCTDRPPVIADERYCMRSSLIFINNTEHWLNHTESGMFCIVHDNLVQRNVHRPVPAVRSVVDLDRVVAARSGRRASYSWYQQLSPPAAPPRADGGGYRSGDRVWAVMDGRLTPWATLWSGVVSDTICDGRRPVQFLTSTSAHCWTPYSADLKYQLDARALYQNICVLADPRIEQRVEKLGSLRCSVGPSSTDAGVDSGVKTAEADDSGGGDATTSSPRYIAIQPYLCADGGAACKPVAELPKPRVIGQLLQDAVLGYRLVVEHADGGVIRSVQLRATLGPVPLLTSDDTAARSTTSRLTAAVSFVRLSAKPEGSSFRKRSGNPGYRRGLPLLAGLAVLRPSRSAEVEERAEGGVKLLSSSTPPRPLLFPSPSADGDGGDVCSRNRSGWRPVQFGLNLWAGCRLSLTVGDCGRAQRVIFRYLLGGLPGGDAGNLSATVLAEFGNPDADTDGGWLPVLGGQLPSGQPLAVAPSGSCSGMVTQLHWRVAYALSGPVARPQPRLVAVQAEFGAAVTVQPAGDGPRRRLHVHLVTMATFLDVTPRPQPEFARPPRIDFRLPSDFFYPFAVTSDATSIVVHIGCVLLVATLLASWLIGIL